METKIKSMKLPCKICGAEKMAGKPRVVKLVEKHGSLDVLLKEYVCRACRGKVKVDVKAKENAQQKEDWGTPVKE